MRKRIIREKIAQAKRALEWRKGEKWLGQPHCDIWAKTKRSEEEALWSSVVIRSCRCLRGKGLMQGSAWWNGISEGSRRREEVKKRQKPVVPALQVTVRILVLTQTYIESMNWGRRMFLPPNWSLFHLSPGYSSTQAEALSFSPTKFHHYLAPLSPPSLTPHFHPIQCF